MTINHYNMTIEEKTLVFRDLCGRLPYGVLCYYYSIVSLVGDVCNAGRLEDVQDDYFIVNGHTCQYGDMKPYLRPMSGMTEEERKEYHEMIVKSQDCSFVNNESATTMVNDWLLSKGFDVRGLIPKGLALEAPEGMYK